MTDPIIAVENLSKRYTIAHQRNQLKTTLREDLMHGVQAMGKRIIHPFSPTARKSNKEDFWALKDVSFDVQAGDRFGIIGRNGAGKSTLLKILSRITTPTTGRAVFKGRVASLLEVGTGFHSELTGRENIYLNGSILGMSQAEIRAKFDEIVAFAEIEKFLDTPVKRYSSGMYVRLAFAIAAHLASEILILDEVLAVGDISFQRKCLGKMDDVSKSGRTVLFVSHDMQAINKFCDKGLYLKQGQIDYCGGISEAITRYNTDAKTDLFGMGRFDLGSLERKGTLDVRFEAIELTHTPRAPDTANLLRGGDDLTIKLDLHCTRATPNFNVAIIVLDGMQLRVIDANFAMEGKTMSMVAGERRRVTFLLKNLLLKPDEYVLGLWAGIPNTDLDSIEEAVRFNVDLPLSYNGGPKIYPGIYRCDFNTTIE